MKGYHAEEISTLNNEELNKLINTLMEERTERIVKEKENFLAKLDNLIEEAYKKGYVFFYKYEPLDLEEVSVDIDDINIF